MQETSEKSVAMYGVVPASKIIGESVVNRQGENVGKIQELLIDANKNRVAYAVLSFGGFPGMGNKLFAMPRKALVPDGHLKIPHLWPGQNPPGDS